MREGREGLVVRLDTWFENVMTMMIVAQRMRFFLGLMMIKMLAMAFQKNSTRHTPR